MIEWFSIQPDWVLYSLATLILIIGILLGRATKKSLRLNLGSINQRLTRIAEALEKK